MRDRPTNYWIDVQEDRAIMMNTEKKSHYLFLRES